MIKKKLKKWYPTKQDEDKARFVEQLLETSQRLHRSTLTGNANWIIVGQDVATQLNTLYPSLTTAEAVDYTNRWCGTTYTTTTGNYIPLHMSTASTMTMLSGNTFNW